MLKKNNIRSILVLVLCLGMAMMQVSCGTKKGDNNKSSANVDHSADFEIATEMLEEWPSAELWAEWGMPNIVQPAGVISVGIMPMGSTNVVGMQVDDVEKVFNALLAQVKKIAGISQMAVESDEHNRAEILLVPDAGIVTVGYTTEDDEKTVMISIGKMQ